jgi:hypothetical protein
MCQQAALHACAAPRTRGTTPRVLLFVTRIGMAPPIASASNRATTQLVGSRIANCMPPTRVVARPSNTAGLALVLS